MEVSKRELVEQTVIDPILASFAHMQLRLLNPSFLAAIAAGSLHCAEQLPSHRAHSGPSIEFTHIPPRRKVDEKESTRSLDGSETLDQSQQLLFYAHSGQWWVQPWPDHPFIPIKADSTWSTETHLGFEYAALLVEPDYHPLPTTDVLRPKAVPLLS